MMGHVFNSAFIDALENDMEHVARINELVGMVINENPHVSTGPLRLVDFLCINPSIEISDLDSKHIGSLPRSMRTILRMTGATPAGGGTSMASYLLFEGAFCRELIACGYRDAMAQEDALMDFFYPQRELNINGDTGYASGGGNGR
jgi:NTE family protein